MDNKSRRNRFKEAMLVGVAGAAAVGITLGAAKGKQDLESMDMSKYNTENKVYEEYIKNSSNSQSKLDHIALLEESIRIYKEFTGKLTDTQQKTLDTATRRIKSEMRSEMLADVYLYDIFKPKIKEAYHAKEVEVKFSMDKGEEHINIIIDNRHMEKNDKTKEITSAVRDIVKLQELSEKESEYTKNDIEKFIDAFDNMKGFSNLTFVKNENGKLEAKENEKLILESVPLPEGAVVVYKAEDKIKDGNER